MPQPFPIKLVLQGGGAKLSAILAAMEELSQRKDLKVTHICGTSAGAVAACLFAARADPGDVRTYFLDHRREFEDAYKLPSLVGSALKLGIDATKPFWSEEPFRKMLHYFLKNDFVTFSDFKNKHDITVEVVSVNVVNGVPNYHAGTASIVDSVLHSSGLPYLFRMTSPVDGGLCENLPVERLLAADKNEKVIAISFLKDEPKLPGGLLDFTLALVNTVINNSVERSKAMLPTHAVLEIDTEITTFDFVKALDPKLGLGHDYKKVREQAKKFFDDYVASETKRTWTAPPHWETTNPSAIAVMENSYEAYRILQRAEPIDTHKITFEVTANSLFPDAHPKKGYDVVGFILDFEAKSRVSCVGVSIVAPPGTAYLNLSDWRIEKEGAIARSKSQMVAVPLRDPNHPKARRIGFYFDPLPPGRYKFVFVDMGNNLMSDLADKGKDVVGFTTWGEGGPTSELDLILHVPDVRPYNNMEIKCGPKANRLTQLQPEHFSLGCCTYLCRASDVSPGTRVFFNALF